MTSVDELFKKPNLPSGKRKYEASDAQEVYKAAKLSSSDSPNGRHANGATVEDAEDDDVEAGPELPPDDEGDDEEGRFFGGGVTEDAAEALDYIDQQDEDGFKEESIDSAWLRRLSVSFEKKVKKNAELRARYENDPQKFMASEADLDAEIKGWSLLSEHPELYEEFAQSDSVGHLVGLLAHENTDIAIGAVEIISELLDEDVQAEQAQWDALVSALLENDLMELLMSNVARLDEEANESDRSGVYHSLSVIENLASQQSIAEKIGTENILMFLCNRISKPEKQTSQNKQYAAEVLQVLLQISPILRRLLAVDMDGVDLFLRLLAPYRKRDPPSDSQEEEFVENIFDSLTCVVDEAEGKSKFVEAEGVELCLIMLKEGSFSKVRSLRLLDHAVGGQGVAAAAVCQKLVDANGIKTIFGMFMKKADSTTIEHIIGIFSALLRLLPGQSAARIRVIAKFTEKDYEKLTKLVQLRQDYARKVAAIDEEINLEQRKLDDEEREERSDGFFSRRLDGGLFCLQMIDVVIAWLAAEDRGAKTALSNRLGDMKPVRESLREQSIGLENGDTQEMLTTLIDFLN